MQCKQRYKDWKCVCRSRRLNKEIKRHKRCPPPIELILVLNFALVPEYIKRNLSENSDRVSKLLGANISKYQLSGVIYLKKGQ